MNKRLSATTTGELRLRERARVSFAPAPAPSAATDAPSFGVETRGRAKPVYNTVGLRAAAEQPCLRGVLEERVGAGIFPEPVERVQGASPERMFGRTSAPLAVRNPQAALRIPLRAENRCQRVQEPNV
jgi:hypothetical protein